MATFNGPRTVVPVVSVSALLVGAVLLGACFGSSDDEPEEVVVEEVVVEEMVELSTCPDTPPAPAGAPFEVSILWCVQEFLGGISLSGDTVDLRSTVFDSIERRFGTFNQMANLEEEDIIILELTFDESEVGGTSIELSGEQSALKLVHPDDSRTLPTAWVEVNDSLRDLENVGAGPFGNFFAQLGASFFRNRSTANDLIARTDPLVVEKDIRVWVPYIFPIDSPPVSVEYNGVPIILNYSPLEED